jgi:hypothetical protein
MAMLGSVLFLVTAAILLGASGADAAWHYKFTNFIFVKTAATSAGLTEARRCAQSPAGDWKFRSLIEVDFASTNAPKSQSVELEIRAVMPITSSFRQVHDVGADWRATLPKDPALAELVAQSYDDLAKSFSDFYEGMSVRWRPAKYKLDVRHHGIELNGNPLLEPGELSTPFKPLHGC